MEYFNFVYNAMLGFFAFKAMTKLVGMIFPKFESINILIDLGLITLLLIFRRKIEKMIQKIEIKIKNGKKNDTKKN